MNLCSIALALALTVGCSSQHAATAGQSASAPVASNVAPGPWRSLMDAKQWRAYRADTVPSRWSFADGMLSKQRPVADIVTRDEFGDFELELEWRIGEAGNSGIFYRGTEEYDHIYWSAPEYQLLDNIKAEDNKTQLTRAAAVYALYPAPDGHVKPVGEWNSTRIIARGPHVEHWLNGTLMAQYDVGSADWNARVQGSKFKSWPHFGTSPRGHIAIQGDHPGTLAFRNIRIRELK